MPLQIDPDGHAQFSAPGDSLHLVGLARELKEAFGDPRLAATWMKQPSPHLADDSPRQRMQAGKVADVRARLAAFLDAERRQRHEADKSRRMQTELR